MSARVSKAVQTLIQNTSPGHAFKLAVAEYAVKCLTSYELIHLEVVDRSNREVLEGHYFRLNILQGISIIGLADWDKLRPIIVLTNRYMDTKKKKTRKITDLLQNSQSVTS